MAIDFFNTSTVSFKSSFSFFIFLSSASSSLILLFSIPSGCFTAETQRLRAGSDIYKLLQTSLIALPFSIFFIENHIMSVVHSGNIEPVLKFYQRILMFDYYIATPIELSGEKIRKAILNHQGDHKESGCNNIINYLGILFDEIISIGDSPSDLNVFKLAKYSIALDPKGRIENKATYAVNGDLFDIIKIITEILWKKCEVGVGTGYTIM